VRAKLGLAAVSVALVGAMLSSAVPAAAAPVVSAATVSNLPPCADVPGARCGSVTVPLDRAHPDGRTIAVAFEAWEHRDTSQPALDPIVAVEGGPGYASRGSRDYYLDLFDPLMERRDLLIVDNRGTGDSGAINCEKLQSYVGSFSDNVGECGRQLGDTADDYGTGNAVEDMIAVLDALGINKINLYGDSYGTFFGQTFAVRHPERIRTLMLDAAYPIEAGDPWYRDSARALRNAFRLACKRAPVCAARGGDPINRMRTLAQQLRRHPITGQAADADGVLQDVKIDGSALSYLAWAASGSATMYRELDPAIRAALRPNPDFVPLLRLGAENLSLGDAGEPVEFSEGLYAAVICHDYPQLWDPNAAQTTKNAQLRNSIASLRREEPDAFAPFTIAEWISQPFSELDYCLQWPAAGVADPPRPPSARYPRVPTLVLTSDLDSNTSPEGAAEVARRFGGTLVESVNYTHVSAMGDFGRCASRIVVRFIRALDPGDTSCSREYNENRMVDLFPRTVAGVAGASPDEKVARAAAATVADIVARWWSMLGEEGVGLRGGTFTTTGLDEARFRLHTVQWVEDLTVNGSIIWDRTTGDISAKVVARRPDKSRSRLTMSWNDWTPRARAAVTGTVDRRPVTFDIPAP
jgi:pimeloyl-ACP methyl ester carboxylesterase